MIEDVDGIAFRSVSQSFCLEKQDIIDLLAEVEIKEEALRLGQLGV